MKVDHTFESLTEAHTRALLAVKTALPGISDDDADEMVTAIVSLVFETLKQYLAGEDVCN